MQSNFKFWWTSSSPHQKVVIKSIQVGVLKKKKKKKLTRGSNWGGKGWLAGWMERKEPTNSGCKKMPWWRMNRQKRQESWWRKKNRDLWRWSWVWLQNKCHRIERDYVMENWCNGMTKGLSNILAALFKYPPAISFNFFALLFSPPSKWGTILSLDWLSEE